jgi:hypothetical protein
MATAVNHVKNTKKDAFHAIFNASSPGCTGMCVYSWDPTIKKYVLEPGDACSGSGCQPCENYKSSILRELVILERSFPNPDAISHVCGVTTDESLESALCHYVALLKRYRLLVKIAIGLGLLSAVLLISLVYLLTR